MNGEEGSDRGTGQRGVPAAPTQRGCGWARLGTRVQRGDQTRVGGTALDRPGGWGGGVKGGPGFIGVRSLGAEERKARSPAAQGRVGVAAESSLRGRSGTKFPERSPFGWGGALAGPGGAGVPARGRARGAGPRTGRGGGPAPTSSHLMNLLPRRRVSATAGGSSCSAWTPGLAPAMAGRGAGGRPAEPRRGPTARLLLRALPRPPRPRGVSVRLPAGLPGTDRDRRGPRGGAGAGPPRRRPLPPPARPPRGGAPWRLGRRLQPERGLGRGRR